MSELPVGSIVTVGVLSLLLTAQPAAAQPATPEQQEHIRQKMDELQQAIDRVPLDSRAARLLPDVGIYHKAADWILRHDEFYRPAFAQHTLEALQTGIERAAALADGPDTTQPPWLQGTGTVILAYRSRVDGSRQPYALALPAGIDPRAAKRWPLHVKLHGRGGTLNEVSFIKSHDSKPLPEGQDWIQLDVFGRVNNAYRWAGETDVFEALADVKRRFRIDEQRITLWGFSMGGAGAWHLALHHPSVWSSAGAGAGFVDFYKYQNVNEPLPEYQHKTLRIYDAVDYALNAFNVPFITYGGELDKQLAASLQMREAARQDGVDIPVLIGMGMGHKFDDKSLAKFMEFHASHTRKGRPSFPGRKEIRFVTWTPKYNTCEWATIEEMTEIYEPAWLESIVGDDGSLSLETTNVDALRIARGVSDTITIDGEGPFSLSEAADGLLPDVYLVRRDEAWTVLDYEQSLEFPSNPQRRKRHNLQGPIDDAFMQPFVCVRGTGEPWSESHQQWADWTLARFEREFDKWMRARVPTVDDADINDEKIAAHNLVLFGDPGSNALIARVLDELPIGWTREELTVNGTSYDANSHGVALIFPNPLNPARYVVINSGMTMHEKDFQASNAWLFPKLGDIAVQKFVAQGDGGFHESIEWAGLFDCDWEP
jgi:dienelactone hydrolase